MAAAPAPVYRRGAFTKSEVIRRAVELRGTRTVFHLAKFCDYLESNDAPADIRGWRDDPNFITAMAAVCVDQNLNAGYEKDAQIIIQAAVTNLPQDQLPELEDTRKFVILQMRHIYQTVGEDVKLTMRNANRVAQDGDAPAFPEVFTVARPQGNAAALQATDEHIKFWVKGIQATTGFNATVIKLLTSVVLMYCKQGTMTVNVQNKVQNAIRDEMQFNINLEAQSMRTAWGACATYMNAEVAAHMFRSWETAIGDHSMRLKLLVQQSGWTSMTNFKNICDAREYFTDFDWERLALIIPEDFRNYSRAVNTVNGNKYYGYNTDLGDAKSTNYPHLAYAAYLLLTEARGDMAMRNFQGINMRLEHSGRIGDMVRDYRHNRDQAMRAAVVNQGARDIVEQFRLLNVHRVAGYVPPVFNRGVPPPLVQVAAGAAPNPPAPAAANVVAPPNPVNAVNPQNAQDNNPPPQNQVNNQANDQNPVDEDAEDNEGDGNDGDAP